jgi:SAM-dependent methyltransferase
MSSTDTHGIEMNPLAKSLRERIRTRDLRVLDRGGFAYTVSNALHYGLRAALRRQVTRDVKFVEEEYHVSKRGEHWRPQLSLDDLIYSDDTTQKWILKDGKLVVATDRVAREYLLARLSERIREFLPDGRGKVVEFGCGTGRNLFYLARTFPNLELAGLDLSESSIEHARQIAKQEGLNVKFEAADVTVDCSRFGQADVVFSVHALEQIPHLFTRAMENMAAMAKRGIILFEPVHELFPRSLRGLAARFRLRNANYLDGLLQHVEASPKLSVAHAAAMPTVGNPLNQTCELVVKVD